MIAEEKKGSVSPDALLQDVRMVENIAIIPEMLNVICRTTGMRFAAVARVTDEKWMTCCVQDEISFGLKPGDELKLETTICNEIRQSNQAVIIDHVAENTAFKDHHTPAMYGFQSYISFPVITKNGGFFGTLCAIDPKPNQLDTPAIRSMFKLFSELISYHLNAAEEVSSTQEQLDRELAIHRKLAENEERLNMVITSSGLGIWELDMVTKKITSSGSYWKILGHPDNTGLTIEDTTKQIPPEDLPARAAAYKDAIETGNFYYTGRIIRPNGDIRWIESLGKTFYDDNHRASSILGTLRDITDEKAFSKMLGEKVLQRTQELNEKNAELEKMNRELHSFTYISGHDLQEPLRKIQTFASLIEAEPESGMTDKVKDYFSRMQKAANRMQTLILDLLEYSRAGTQERKYEHADLATVIREVQDNMKEEIREKNAAIEINSTCAFNMIPFQMRQLFQNLLSNALKFSAPARTPHVTINSQVMHVVETGTARLSPEKEYCRITVKDNGIGFEAEYNEKVFELFQRLHGKAAYNGTGIGLSIVKKIAENHGGVVTAEGHIGEGAEFNIYIPLS